MYREISWAVPADPYILEELSSYDGWQTAKNLSINNFIYCTSLVITVPVLHSYIDDDGYYITARPSDVGNITYQVSEEAETLLSELDYRDEDDLPWGIINPLRSAGLIYTNSQGVDHHDDAPNLDPTKLPELTQSEIQKLLDYLESRKDISEEIYRQIEEKIESKDSLLEQIGQRIHPKFPDEETYLHVTWASDEADHKIKKLRIELRDRDVAHIIGMWGDSTVGEWKIEHPYGDSWHGAAEASEALSKLMNALGDINSDLPVEIKYYETHRDPFSWRSVFCTDPQLTRG
jgi:hypothetical protein